MGSIHLEPERTITSLFVAMDPTLESALPKLREIEEPQQRTHLSSDEVVTEDIFNSSIQRLDSSQFNVALPLKHKNPILGDSRGMAKKMIVLFETSSFKKCRVKTAVFGFYERLFG